MAEYLVPRKLLLSNTKETSLRNSGINRWKLYEIFGYYIEGLLRWLEQKKMIGIVSTIFFPIY